MKNKYSINTGKGNLRKSLLIFQYTISIGLVICTLIIRDQLEYFQKFNLGFDKERVLKIDLGYDKEMQDKYPVIKSQFGNLPGIQDVTGSPLPQVSGVGSFEDSLGNAVTIYFVNVDRNFFDFYDVQFEQGGNFNGSQPDNQVIVNKAYVKQFNLKDPLAEKVEIRNDEGNRINADVVGVTKNFKFGSLKSEVAPVIFRYSSTMVRSINVRLKPGDTGATVSMLNNQWKKIVGDRPFEFQFLDEIFDKFYRKEQMTGSLFQYFSIIAITIAYMGLFGLTSFIIRRKIKEIGIRKIFGAQSLSLSLLFTRDFLFYFPLSFTISSLVAYFYMNSWLEGFAYRIEISSVNFLIGGLVLFLFSVLMISSQTIHASRINPSALLREE